MHEFYKISADRLTEIADRIRVMAGLTRKMTPAEMIEWLSKVQFTPSTVGESEFTIVFSNNTASGVVPDVHNGFATSEFTVNFGNSVAIGILPDVVEALANSEITLNFESTAIGALQEV